MGVKVKNLEGTQGNSCTCCGSWLGHWKNKTGNRTPLCSQYTCNKIAEVGAHELKK